MFNIKYILFEFIYKTLNNKYKNINSEIKLKFIFKVFKIIFQNI